MTRRVAEAIGRRIGQWIWHEAITAERQRIAAMADRWGAVYPKDGHHTGYAPFSDKIRKDQA